MVCKDRFIASCKVYKDRVAANCKKTFIAAIRALRKLRMVFYKFFSFFWSEHCCWTEARMFGHDLFVF